MKMVNSLKKIKIGVLGCGQIGLSFIKNIQLLPDLFEVTALYSVSKASVEVAKKFAPGASILYSKEDFLKASNIEAVIICSPHAFHAEDAIKALKAGKHVLIEKPIATNIDKLRELVKVANKNLNLAVLALPHCQDRVFEVIADLVQDNYIGKVTKIDSQMNVPGPPRANWYYKKEAIGGASLDTFPYVIGRVLHIVPQGLLKAYGLSNHLVKYRKCLDGNNIVTEVDDSISIIAQLFTGQELLFRSNWNVNLIDDSLTVYGRNGTIIADCWKQTVKLVTNKAFSYKNDYCEVQKFDNKEYMLQLNSENSELTKLKIFHDSVINRKSNIKEVGYFMELILSCLKQNGILKIPTFSPYQNSKLINNFKIGEEYI